MGKTAQREKAKSKRTVTTSERKSGGSPAVKQARAKRTPAAASSQAPEAADPIGSRLRAIENAVAEIHHVLMPPLAAASDHALEGSVDSLRRLLSELVEQRMEAVVRDLVEVRRQAASRAADAAQRTLDRLDDLLDALGAVRFEAEPMDVVDPLIHTVSEERPADEAPDGVIVATLAPGYRSGRGLVLCKAAVAISRGN